jgi:tetratricopeptide (TPR) repeat protein
MHPIELKRRMRKLWLLLFVSVFALPCVALEPPMGSTAWQGKIVDFKSHLMRVMKIDLAKPVPGGFVVRIEFDEEGNLAGRPFMSKPSGDKAVDDSIIEQIGALPLRLPAEFRSGFSDVCVLYSPGGVPTAVEFGATTQIKEIESSKKPRGVVDLADEYPRAKDRIQQRYGKFDPFTAFAWGELADRYRDIGDAKKYAECAQQQAAIFEKAGASLPNFKFDGFRALENLSHALVAVNDVPGAERAAEKAFAASGKTGVDYINLASIYGQVNDQAKAEATLRRATKAFGEDNYGEKAMAYQHLGDLLAVQKHNTEALENYDKALVLYEKNLHCMSGQSDDFDWFESYLQLVKQLHPANEAAVVRRIMKISAIGFPTEKQNVKFKDKTGKVFLTVACIEAREFHEGRCAVAQPDRLGNRRWGFIDTNGVVKVPYLYEEVSDFQGGRAIVREPGKKLASGFDQVRDHAELPTTLVDANGNQVTNKFANLDFFSEGLAAAAPFAGKEKTAHHIWGYIDAAGNFVIQPQFTRVKPFKNGLAAVEKYGHMYHNGCVPEFGGGQWGLIDKTGRYVVQPKYSQAEEAEQAAMKIGGVR